MNFINPPTESPQYVTHRTFYSQLLNHEVGFNIYLPHEYRKFDGVAHELDKVIL